MKTRAAWRRWLSRNHAASAGVWLVFYKKHTGKPSLQYAAAVEEALCFGWIDSIVKKLDDERYLRKLTPRRPQSSWSDLNKKRVARLGKQGLMTEAGLAKVKAARKSGAWDKSDRPQIPSETPVELARALAKNAKARSFFDQLAPSRRMQFVGWIATAKRPETKQRRVKESIVLLERGRKLGMK